MADTLLKVDNINVYYGNIHAVKDISFEVNQGEIVTLIGANGAGKSTTLKTLSSLKIRKLFNQLVFATEKSLQYLKFEGRELV